MPADDAEDAAEAVEVAANTGRQRVTWAELFLDLTWVFAVTQIAGTLAGAHGMSALARTLLLLIPLWWGWVGATLLGNAAGAAIDGARGRLILFVIAGCGLGMTVAVPGAYAGRGLLFAGCYFALRLLLWAEMRRQPFFGGLRVEPFAVSLLVSGPLFLVGGVATGPWRVGAWAAAALIEVLSPTLLGHRLDHVRFETEHLPERFGLFIIIALGETVVAVGSQAASVSLDALTMTTLVLSFGLIAALWWTYFHFGAPAVQHSLATDPVQARIVRDVFSYGHFVYVVAIICLAVGLKKLLAHPLAAPHGVPELLLAPGAGLYLLGFCYARLRMFGAVGLPRFLSSLACFGLAFAAPLLPAIAVAALVTAVLVVLNAVEAWRVATGRPLPLVPMPHRRRRRSPA